MREETEFVPKPMVQIGGKPVLWHIMKIYASFGIREFVIAAGYKAEVIKNYFLNFEAMNKNFSIETKSGALDFHGPDLEDWRVTVLDTGLDSQTGLRLWKSQSLFEPGETFMCTYGDGLAPVDLRSLLENHTNSNRLATITVTRPTSRFGVVDFDDHGAVREFREKQPGNDFVNIGFMVLDGRVFDLLGGGNDPLETGLLRALADQGQLNAFRHDGFWEPMDTFREYQHLNSLWASRAAPWKVWQD